MPLDRPVAEILKEPGRDWTPNVPADEDEIAELRALVPFELPAEYVELLRYCDGGDGELDLPPLLFSMESIAESVEHNEAFHRDGFFADFWFIGTNGGLETIAFDLRTGPPYPIVMIDCNADGTDVKIADDMAQFISKIGIRAADATDDDQGEQVTW